MRSLQLWGCATLVMESMVQLAVADDWRCGQVQHAGTVWVPDANPACTAEGTISHNKCWLRKGVQIYDCQPDDDYDYYWRNAIAGGYEKWAGKNCYAMHGVQPGVDTAYGYEPLFLNLGACQKACSKDPVCEGFVIESPVRTEEQELELDLCWLRDDLHLSKCHNGTGFDTYLHTAEHPANFDEHFDGMNCHPGAGSADYYGASELKYVDGSLVSHLGDCKAACHRDNRCEGITVKYKNRRTLLNQDNGVPVLKPVQLDTAPAAHVTPLAGAHRLEVVGSCGALGFLVASVLLVRKRARAVGEPRGRSVQAESRDGSDRSASSQTEDTSDA